MLLTQGGVVVEKTQGEQNNTDYKPSFSAQLADFKSTLDAELKQFKLDIIKWMAVFAIGEILILGILLWLNM